MRPRRTPRPLAVLVALVLTGLSGCDQVAPPDPGTSAPPDAASSTSAAPSVPTTGARSRPPSPTGPTPTTGSPTTAPKPSGGAGGRSADDRALSRAATGPVGGFARTLLGPGAATSVVVEVLAQPGAEVAEQTLRRVTGLLEQQSGKGVSLRRVALDDATARAWTAEDLYALADSRGAPQAGGAAVLRLALVHGTFAGEDSALGVAVRGDLAAILVDKIARTGSLLVSSSTVEEAVVVHEVGHLLGLVDLARDTGREDPEHPGHSTNRQSVMYWAIESDLVLDLLAGGPPTDFDDADRADLAALRSAG